MQPVSKQRLMKGESVLEGEGSKLAELGIEYDDELLLVYKLEGRQSIQISNNFHQKACILQ